MALTDDGGMVMPVGPVNNGYSGFGGFGGDGLWILILFILLLGNNGFGGFGNDGGLYPWMNQSNQMTSGFRDQMLNDSMNSIRDGIGGIQNSLCNGFAGVNATVNNGFASAEIANNSRQMANMNQAFSAQNAMTQGFNNVQSQLANCCCENRLGIADLKYTVATENCADRSAAYQNTRDIIDSQTRGTQAILDKLCALELDNVKAQLAQAQRENVSLQNAVNMATMQASQVAQTAELRASQATTANQLVSELRSCPIPCQPVYGNSPIFTCNNGTCGA